jgi:hypothetical protein
MGTPTGRSRRRRRCLDCRVVIPSQVPVHERTLPVDGDYAVGVGVEKVTDFAGGAAR